MWKFLTTWVSIWPVKDGEDLKAPAWLILAWMAFGSYMVIKASR